MSGYSPFSGFSHPKYKPLGLSYPTPEQRASELPLADAVLPPDRTIPPVTISSLPDGILGTATVIAQMNKLVLDAYNDERVNQLARQITASCPRHDAVSEASTLLSWMQSTFRYTRLPYHPNGLQRVQTASYTLFDAPTRDGECASLCVALGAMLMSLGHQIAWRTGGSDASDPEGFEHVWIAAVLGSDLVALDPSYEGVIGWQHPDTAVTRDWTVE